MADTNPSELHIELAKHLQLTQAITDALSQFIAEENPYILFNGLLDSLLELTDSEYGFIGEVFYDEFGQPYIKSYATTDISWSKETSELYQQNKEKGMTFSKVKSLYGEVLTTGQFVISNEPKTDPRAGGIPKGHPPLNTFLGIPFYCDKKMLGVVGIANRVNGYQAELVDYLQPFLTTCGNLIQSYRNNIQRHHVEQELASYKKRLQAIMNKPSPQTGHSTNILSLAPDYFYCLENRQLTFKDKLVVLTKKESMLLHLLASNKNQIVTHQTLEQEIWPDVVVSDSSLRALLLKLRKKLPTVDFQTVSGIGIVLKLSKTA